MPPELKNNLLVKKSWFLFWGILSIIIFYIGARFFFQPVSVVLPHHNLVKNKRLEFLKTIAQKRPFTRHVFLIGPDHFSANQTGIFYADTDWDLSNGQLLFNKSLKISGLTLNNNLIRSDIFTNVDYLRI